MSGRFGEVHANWVTAVDVTIVWPLGTSGEIVAIVGAVPELVTVTAA